MLQIMLCGAHDVRNVSKPFAKVAAEFGAHSWFYREGDIFHINSGTARFVQNSLASVERADICVFVMLDSYGPTTWDHELQKALDSGKPFVVLALSSAWARYNILLECLSDLTAVSSPDDQKMVELLRMLSSDYEITVVTFDYDTFSEHLRAALSILFEEGMRLLEMRNRRSNVLESLPGTTALSPFQRNELIAIATDEYEQDKSERKTALRRLAEEGVRDEELLLAVCGSQEQGVQRMGFDLLPSLIPIPPSEDLLHNLAAVAGKCDDVGIARRFISSVATVRPVLLDAVFETAGTAEVGARRQAFEGVEKNYKELRMEWGLERMDKFLAICQAKQPGKPDWIQRLKNLRENLE